MTLNSVDYGDTLFINYPLQKTEGFTSSQRAGWTFGENLKIEPQSRRALLGRLAKECGG